MKPELRNDFRARLQREQDTRKGEATARPEAPKVPDPLNIVVAADEERRVGLVFSRPIRAFWLPAHMAKALGQQIKDTAYSEIGKGPQGLKRVPIRVDEADSKIRLEEDKPESETQSVTADAAP